MLLKLDGKACLKGLELSLIHIFAIAKSFTEAQGGEFHFEVDGDLFKVVILF